MRKINLDQLLIKAERLCQARNTRLTPQRREVLRLMGNIDGAISAYSLLDQLKVIEPQAKPPTIYRALDFLLEQGFIHKVESTNSYILCHHFDQPSHTSALLVCHECGGVTEQEGKGLEQFLKLIAEKSNFAIQHSIVEVHGNCHHCQSELSKS